MARTWRMIFSVREAGGVFSGKQACAIQSMRWTFPVSSLFEENTLRTCAALALCLIMSAPFVGGGGKDKHPADDHVFLKPDDIKWGPAPSALPPGAQMAILAGDPSRQAPNIT